MAENYLQKIAPTAKNALQKLIDVAQGASNSVASGVTVPVDSIAWALRKAGVPVGYQPVGGSDWMNAKGLTVEPKDKIAGGIGEVLGGVLPTLATAKVPQIAGALIQAGKNISTPAKLGSESGVFLVSPNKTNAQHLEQVKNEMEKLGAPTIRAYWDGEKYIALEGSHRAKAAYELGLTPNIEEVQLKQWIQNHDFPDLKPKASTNRILDYLHWGQHSGAQYHNFDDLL